EWIADTAERRRRVVAVVITLTVIFPRNIVGREFIGDGGHRLRWDRERCAGCGLATRRIARRVVIEQVIGVGSAVAVDPVWLRLQIAENRPDARLRGIGTIAVAAAGVAVLCVVIIRAGFRVGVLNLVARRDEWLAMAIAIEG